MVRTIFVILASCFLFIGNSNAQLFKRLGDRIQDKLEKKVEDKLVEELSEEIANRAMRPLDKAFDDMFKAKYKEEHGEEYDESKYEGDPEGRDAAMQAMMSSMFGNVNLPEKIEFDYAIAIDVYDYGEKKPNRVKMLISTSSNTFGMEQSQGGDKNIIVFEGSADKMYLFNESKKTVMAMSGIMGMASVMGKQELEKELDKDLKIEKTSKTKKILGYKSTKYKMESEEDKGEFYLSTDLPFQWKDSFGGMIEKLSPQFYEKHPEYNQEGMLLEAKTKRKKDKKESKWITKEISNKKMIITTSEYKNALQSN